MDIKYVKDNAGNNFFPLVHEKGVVDDNGTTLESKLQSKQDTISDIEAIRSGANLGTSSIQSVTVGTTTTGAAGTNASVTNTGTATEPVLSFTIPQGAQGIQGIQGPQGERGPQGNTGVTVESVNSIIHSIDPTATYAAADVAGADAVQDVLAEVTELEGNVALGAIYDVSAKNPTAGSNNDGKFESLSALLSDANLNTLIPTANRKGGMSIKFVQSSDNRYVQYRCMAQNFTTNGAQWQGVDEKLVAGSKNLVESGGVKTYVDEKINPIELEIYPEESVNFSIPNKFINKSDGMLKSAGGYVSTDFVNIEESAKIISLATVPSTVAQIAFYSDADGTTFLSAISKSNVLTVIYAKDFPVGAKYVRFSANENYTYYANLYVKGMQQRLGNIEKSINDISVFVTPQMYGAKGDGVTDDTNAFQQLEGKNAFIPEGEYMVSNVKYTRPTTLIGAGTQKSIIHQIVGSAKSLFEYDSPTGCVMSDLQLLGNLSDVTKENDHQALLKLYSTTQATVSGYGCSFRNLMLKKANVNGLVMLGSGSTDDAISGTLKALWVFSMYNIIINECNAYCMIDETSDNRYSNFYLAAGLKGGLFCNGVGSNQYCNFKVDGPNSNGTEDSWDDGALVIVKGSGNLQMVNFDLQSGSYVGAKISDTSYLQFRGSANHCGLLAQDGGTAMKLKNTKYSDIDLVIFDTTSPNVQTKGVTIDSTCEFVNVLISNKNFATNRNSNPAKNSIIDVNRRIRGVYENMMLATSERNVISSCDDAFRNGLRNISIFGNKIASEIPSPSSPQNIIPTPVTTIVVADRNMNPYYGQSLGVRSLYCAGNDYRDELKYRDGYWYLIRKTAMIKLDGSESWSSDYYEKVYTLETPSFQRPAQAQCSHFQYSYTSPNLANRLGKIYVQGGLLNIGYDNNAGGVTNFKNWLQSNNVYFIYSLTEPVETKLSRVEAINLFHGNNKLYANDGTSENEVEFTYEVDLSILYSKLVSS